MPANDQPSSSAITIQAIVSFFHVDVVAAPTEPDPTGSTDQTGPSDLEPPTVVPLT